MSFHILTIEPLNNGNYRLGLFSQDFHNIIAQLNGDEIFVSLPNINQDIQVAHDIFYNHGLLFDVKVSEWILLNNYHDYPPGMPFKLIFSFSNGNFAYYPNQAH